MSGTAGRSLFDADGTWCGYEEHPPLLGLRRRRHDLLHGRWPEGGGPLAGQFRLGAPFAFGVIDSDANRVYTGPDFFGTGQPYGTFVDSHYYGPGWQVDLNTWNQVLGDETQVYSSMLYQGPAVVGCFNGVYTRAAIDADAARGPRTWRPRPATGRCPTSCRPSRPAPTVDGASCGAPTRS